MANQCACDRDYDSDTGTTQDYVCDWCSCDHTAECMCHATDISRIKEFYYEMHAVGGHLLVGVETLGGHLHLQYDVLRRLCAFVQERPDFFSSHPNMRGAIVDSLRNLLQERMAEPLYDLFRETLIFVARLMVRNDYM